MKVIVATGNKDKMAEIREIMEDVFPDAQICSMKEAGVECDPEENGCSFEENALIKARAVKKLAQTKHGDCIIFADDSGLVIDCLNGEPGIFSARYMGRETPYSAKNLDLIGRVDATGDKKRSARFVCAVACVLQNGDEIVVHGTIEGVIAHAPSGNKGFGYDPIFWVPSLNCTTADIPAKQKNEISHRGNALRLMKEELVKYENSRNK